MKKITIGFILLLLQLNLLFSQSFKSSYRKISTEDGLSQVTVNTLYQDSNGFIWAGTFDGLNRYDGNEFVVFRNNPTDSTSLSDNTIIGITEDEQRNLWVATGGGGICKFNPKTNRFKRYLNLPDGKSRLTDNVIFVIHKDAQNRIWAGHRKGLDLYNESTDRFEAIKIDDVSGPRGAVFNMMSDKNDLWLATGSGLKLLNTETFKIERVYKSDPLNDNSISSNSIKRFTIDKDGLLWIVMPNYAVNTINRNTGKITRYFQNTNNSKGINNPQVKFVHPDDSGIIWFATDFYGLVMFDQKTATIKYPDQKAVSPTSFSDYQAITILQDKQGSLWVGTLSDGIIHYDANANSFGYKPNLFTSPYDSRTDGVRSIFETIDGSLWISSDKKGLSKIKLDSEEIESFDAILSYLKIDKLRVNDIIQDTNGIMWIGTRDHGLIRINPVTNEFKVYFNKLDNQNPIGSNSFHLVTETSDGLIWLGSVGILTSFNPKTEVVTTYAFNPNEKKSLPGTIVSALYEDFNNNLWVGFFSSGLYRLNQKSNTFVKAEYKISENFAKGPVQITCLYQNNKDVLWIGSTKGLLKYNLKNNTALPFNTKNGLPNNNIYDILEDNSGNLWLSTTNGISKFDPLSSTFKNYNSEDGLHQSEFNYQASQIGLKSGLMYFGGTKGFNFFNPAEITENLNIPAIVFTEFKKYDTQGEFIRVPGINFKDKLELDYKERDFSLKIAALDYTNPSKNQYAYWLEGYNDNWIEIETKREINFTNLSPGSYKLRVKGSNNDGIWNEQGRLLLITILPPWWGTWWAYLLYALMLLALLYAAYQYRINQLETIRLKELDEAKRTMFTNITHEFRTPLTVISGISKELRERSNEQDKEHLDLIDRSSNNMLYLVNQLLELRKLEIGKTEVNYIQDDIIPYLKYIAESFKTYAKTRDISLHFVTIAEQIQMDYDPDKLLMILSNLLSNAIKHSKSGGDVYLQIDEKESKLQIRVVDSGNGIPEEQLPHIFDRFYKVQSTNEGNVDGVGIGLAVTKELTELLKGEITASSRLGQGSIFTVTLPIENKAPHAKVVESDVAKPISFPNVTNKQATEISQQKLAQEAMQLLVIEDNKDILQYLKNLLEQQWSLQLANDGQVGIDKAIENVPDIILCDLMMPNANGYKVLEVLKNDPRTSHIPIVILTAKSDDESRIKAYKKGADAYLLKPFNKNVLLALLHKLVEQRKMFQERIKTQASLRFADVTEMHKEDTFIKKLEELVLSEDTKSSYSIKRLCADLGMSRTQLHNKIKALTGKSTSIFVRSLRLQKGKHLLEHTSKGISEIAYDVGFNNPSYFSKSFTEEFGIPPSSLRK